MVVLGLMVSDLQTLLADMNKNPNRYNRVLVALLLGPLNIPSPTPALCVYIKAPSLISFC